MADGTVLNCRTNLSYGVKVNKFVCSSEPVKFVKLKFCCNLTVQEEYDRNGILYTMDYEPLIFSVDLNFQNSEEEYNNVRRELSSCGLLTNYLEEYQLDELVNYVVRKTEKLTDYFAKSSYAKSGYNELCLDFEVNLKHYHDVIGGMEPILQLSFQESVPDMVPATQESINSLKRKRTAGGGRRTRRKMKETSCVICLDDFSEDCEVVSMPCDHEFHEGCLEEWLKVSHYCPICRYEMPTK